MIDGTRITTICMAIIFSLFLTASAGEVGELIPFENGRQADADQVNAHFDAVKEAVNDNNEKINALSQPRSASVTYSAMGFVPEDNNIQFSKDIDDGSLSVNGGGRLLHSISLRSGLTITRIRVHVKDESSGAQVTVYLKKKEIRRDPISLVTVIANVSEGEDSEQVFEQDLGSAETIGWSETGPLPNYYLEVFLNGSGVYLYSVTLDFEYTVP